MKEQPSQTFERVTGMRWPGGRSDVIRALLRIFNIQETPGTAHANIALQQRLQVLDPADRITDIEKRGHQSIFWRLLSQDEQLLFLAGVSYQMHRCSQAAAGKDL